MADKTSGRGRSPTRSARSTSNKVEATASAVPTAGGPARRAARSTDGELVAKARETQTLAAGMPFNRNKDGEYGRASRDPQPGGTVKDGDHRATGNTVTEVTATAKVGAGKVNTGFNPGNLPLDRARADSSGRPLTTNQGVSIADNQSSLKAGLRGPALLEDFVLRDKITHFDHERIPERIVHARGSAAHGYFQCYKPMVEVTRASLFAEAGKRTPVFVRFSTVIGERGSADTPRDVRGFAVKFYTDEGNWDLVNAAQAISSETRHRARAGSSLNSRLACGSART